MTWPGDEVPLWATVDGAKWVEPLRSAWLALWTGANPPRESKALVYANLWEAYNDVALGRIPPIDAAESALELMDLENYLGITAGDRDQLGITPLLEPRR